MIEELTNAVTDSEAGSDVEEVTPEPQPAAEDTAAATEPEATQQAVDAEELLIAAESVDTDRARLKAIIEAVIYITDEPLSAQQIAGAVNKPLDQIKAILDELNSDYAQPDRGLSIREVAGGYKMATKPEHHEEIRAFVKNLKPPLKLSLAALETLAVIAYKQPITAPEIMEIRGVQGAGVLKTLLDRKLIATAGRKNVIGKPILYKTTKEFLLQFGLKDLSELPTLKEFEELGRLALTDAEAEPTPVDTAGELHPAPNFSPAHDQASVDAAPVHEPGHTPAEPVPDPESAPVEPPGAVDFVEPAAAGGLQPAPDFSPAHGDASVAAAPVHELGHTPAEPVPDPESAPVEPPGAVDFVEAVAGAPGEEPEPTTPVHDPGIGEPPIQEPGHEPGPIEEPPPPPDEPQPPEKADAIDSNG